MINGFPTSPMILAIAARESAERFERDSATDAVIGALQQAFAAVAVQNKGLALFNDTLVGIEDLIGELEGKS